MVRIGNEINFTCFRNSDKNIGDHDELAGTLQITAATALGNWTNYWG